MRTRPPSRTPRRLAGALFAAAVCGALLAGTWFHAAMPFPAGTADVKLRDRALQGLADGLAGDADPEAEAGRAGLLAFTLATYPRYLAEPAHALVAAALDRVVAGDLTRLMLFAPPQHGKLIADPVPVSTPRGWTTHGALRPGDCVFGRDGRPVRVIAVSPPGAADREVAFTDGAVIACHARHEWVVFDRAHRGAERILETDAMMATGAWPGEQDGRYQVDRTDPARRRRAIAAIRVIDPVPGRCIQVEGGVYLAGPTLIPTHNSELASVRLPAYWLGRRPDDPVILASYGADLAYSKSRQARGVVEGAAYRRLFPAVRTRRDSRAVNRWELAAPHRGSLLAVGVGGPVTGHGALLGVIDDPFENWAQAQSAAMRERVWEWYRTTFRTRIWEGGAIVLIMTRWHADDLAGRLLQAQADRWTALRLPALAETPEDRAANDAYLGVVHTWPPGTTGDPLGRAPGAPLAPGRFGAAALSGLQADVGPVAWAAEYQGVPRPREGAWFRRAWFPIVEAAPAKAVRVRYWDKAGTAAGGAYTAGVLLARGEDGVVYVEDVVRGQWEAGEREAVIRQTAEVDRKRHGQVAIYVEQEPGSGGKESAQATIRSLQGFAVRADRPTGDKDVRLEPLAAQAQAGNVRLVRGAWNGDWIEELVAVPSGTYRDQADAAAGAFNKLAEAYRPAWRSRRV